MIITAIKQQVKDANRVSIFVDGKYSFSLTLDELIRAKIKTKQEVSETDIVVFKKMSEDGKMRMRALAWLFTRPHSVKELKDYLYRKKVDGDTATSIVSNFIEKGYVDDVAFAKWFAEQRLAKKKSIRAITAELRSKGIDQVTIQSIVSDISTTDESDASSLTYLVNKLRNRTRYQDEKKLIAYLVSKGFRYADVKEAIRPQEQDS